MPELPPMPSDPVELLAWVSKLSPEQRREVLDEMMNGPASGTDLLQDPFDRANPDIDLPPAPTAPRAYTLRVDIADAKPPIWRRLVVRSDVTLDVLHGILQAAFGWWDSHLHRFAPGDPYTGPYFVTQYDVEQEGDTGTPEHEARLDQVLIGKGDRLTYEYDFGDSWTHRIKLESADPWPEEETRTAWCVTGRNAGPLEDSGGTWGYNELAAWVRSGFAAAEAPEESEDLRSWLPEGFDPDEFSVEDTNEAIAGALLGDAGLIARTLGLRDGAVAFARSVTGASAAILARWLTAGGFGEAAPGGAAGAQGDAGTQGAAQGAAQTDAAQTDAGQTDAAQTDAGQTDAAQTDAGQTDAGRTRPAPHEPGHDRTHVDPALAESATRLWRVLLRHVGAGVTLTKAGYLPPTVVEAVYRELDLDAALFGRGNREDQTAPVLLLRESAQDLGLLRKSKGELLPTATARKLADDPVALLRHIAGRLPRGRREDEQQAGWAVLMATVAGEDRKVTYAHVADLLTGLGWRTAAGGVDPNAARWAADPTRTVLDIAGGELMFSRRGVPTGGAVVLARLALVKG